MKRTPLDLISDAYLLLLQVQEEPLRSSNQTVYAELRDHIAQKTGKDPEDVQNRYEEIANVLRESIEWKRQK